MTHGSHDVARLGAAGALALLLTLAGCGTTGSGSADGSEGLPADARKVLTCRGPVLAHGRGDYDSGLATVEGTPERALDTWLVADRVGPLPPAGYERSGGAYERLVFTFEGGVAAVVLDSDIRDFSGEQGWGVASWAVCDPSEMSEEASSAVGFLVWEDSSGQRVPTSVLESYHGAAHCGWQDLTVLRLDGRTYVDGVPDGVGGRLRAEPDPDVELPDAATDTGYRRDGRELWVGGGSAYVVDDGQVARWPSVRGGLSCA